MENINENKDNNKPSLNELRFIPLHRKRTIESI